MTSSARASILGWTVTPIVFAVLRLITSWRFVGCSTGRLPGLAPLRIWSTCFAACRYSSGRLGNADDETGFKYLAENNDQSSEHEYLSIRESYFVTNAPRVSGWKSSKNS